MLFYPICNACKKAFDECLEADFTLRDENDKIIKKEQGYMCKKCFVLFNEGYIKKPKTFMLSLVKEEK